MDYSSQSAHGLTLEGDFPYPSDEYSLENSLQGSASEMRFQDNATSPRMVLQFDEKYITRVSFEYKHSNGLDISAYRRNVEVEEGQRVSIQCCISI